MASTLMGLYDVLNSFNLLGTYSEGLADRAHLKAEIVATAAGSLSSASGVPVEAKRSIKQIDSADVIIIPSIMVQRGEWQQGRYPGLVKWLAEMHAAGAQLCFPCSGVLLLAETGRRRNSQSAKLALPPLLRGQSHRASRAHLRDSGAQFQAAIQERYGACAHRLCSAAACRRGEAAARTNRCAGG